MVDLIPHPSITQPTGNPHIDWSVYLTLVPTNCTQDSDDLYRMGLFAPTGHDERDQNENNHMIQIKYNCETIPGGKVLLQELLRYNQYTIIFLLCQ